MEYKYVICDNEITHLILTNKDVPEIIQREPFYNKFTQVTEAPEDLKKQNEREIFRFINDAEGKETIYILREE